MKLTDRANSRLWDALLTEALTEHCERELERLDGTESVGFSPEFDKKIKKLRRSVGIKEQAAGFGKAARSIALTLAVVLSLCFCALLTQQEVYAAVQNVIRETFSDHDYITFKSDVEPETGKQLRLGYVPEGYELMQINFAGGFGATYLYDDGNDNYLTFDYGYSNGFFIDIDNEHSDSKEVTRNGQTYYYYYPKNHDNNLDSALIWYNDGYAYCISVPLSLEELVKIAENIVEYSIT